MDLCTYLLPFRRAAFNPAELGELRIYLQMLRQINCEVLVIDGSPPDVYADNATALDSVSIHHPVDRRFGCKNDKVNGVYTGVDLAACEKIILADDDIRYAPAQIQQVIFLLEAYEVVRPQNYLVPLPWWAQMEAARMLVNRATLRAADYPGTCAFRRETIRKVKPYDGDVLFDNEEIIRNFAYHGARIAYSSDLFVEKRAPRFRKWLEQRPRQAYEDFGLRIKTILFALILPLLLSLAIAFGWRGWAIGLGIITVVSFGLAFAGRKRGRADEFFPMSAPLFAPLWILERSVSTYWAFYWYVTRGGYPFGDRILSKGIGRAWKRGAMARPRRKLADDGN